MTDLRPLRQQIRTLRKNLTAAEREQYAQQIRQRIQRLNLFHDAQHISAFLAFDGEPDLQALLIQANELGKITYLPILLGKQQPMLFAPYRPGDLLKPNWFNIPEPDVPRSQMIEPQQLDLVLTPLVAFDEQANRLGVGGGFYDRSFAFLNENRQASRTHLLGIAFELQKVESLPRRDWDVPLDGIVTEEQLYPGYDGTMLE